MSKVYLMRKGDSTWSPMVTDGAEEVRFDFTFDNLENPTNYVSERAFSLRLPRCAENNKFFGHICRLDSIVVAGGYTPTEKMRYMVLDSAGLLISTGDAVVSEISRTEYVLSLVGSQARMFRRLLNAGWNTAKAAEDSDYTLMTDWLKLVKVGNTLQQGVNVIDAPLVYTSWEVDNPIFLFEQILSTNLRQWYGLADDANVSEAAAFVASLVGFAPVTQGRYKDFDSKTWYEKGEIQVTPDVTIPATDVKTLPVLCSLRDVENNAIVKTQLDEGTVDVQMAEFRSYYMQPYIYMSALWQMIRRECRRITGYNMVLDNRWFNNTNNELRRLVYMLPPLSLEEGGAVGSISETYKLITYNFPSTLTGYAYTLATTTPPELEDAYGKMVNDTKPTYTSTSATLLCPAQHRTRIDSEIRLTLDGSQWTNLLSSHYDNMPLYFSGFNPFDITVEAKDADNNTLLTKKYLLFMLPTDGHFDLNSLTSDDYIQRMMVVAQRDGYEVVTANYEPLRYDQQLGHYTATFIDINLPLSIMAEADVDVKIVTTLTTHNAYIPFVYDDNGTLRYFYLRSRPLEGYGRIVTGGSIFNAKRSHSTISLERLFENVNPFEVLLGYAKSHNLLWVVDDDNSTVRVIRRADFFADITELLDVSERVDVATANVSPLSWNERTAVFNLDAIGVDGESGYEERHGHTFGSKVIITENALNSDKKNLLAGIKTSVMRSVTVAPCGILKQLTSQSQATYIEVAPMPANVSDGESAEVSGNFYYRHDNDQWQGALVAAWHPIYITDDYTLEVNDENYCWHGLDILAATGLQTTTRPVFNTVSGGGLSVLFAPVREQYTSTPDMPTAYLYERYWQKYVEEVYNAQNKTLEVDIYLPRAVFDRVRQNPLVVIDHVPYLLTDIDGWGEHNTVCRCTLRQITNINNLTT